MNIGDQDIKQHQHEKKKIIEASSGLQCVCLAFTVLCSLLELAVFGGAMAMFIEQNQSRNNYEFSSFGRNDLYGWKRLEAVVDSAFINHLRAVKSKGLNQVKKQIYIGPNNASVYVASKKPVGHVVGDSNKRKFSSTTYIPNTLRICAWTSQHDLAFLKNGVDFRNDRLIVSQTGTYFVYSQVHFIHREYHMKRRNQSPKIDPFPWNNSVPTSHFVYRYNLMYPNTKEEKLLESVNTKNCLRDRISFQFSSYVGANVHLRVGDELFVKVSGVGYVPHQPRSNSFGLYLL